LSELAKLPHPADNTQNLVLVLNADGKVVDEYDGRELDSEEVANLARECEELAERAAQKYREYANNLRAVGTHPTLVALAKEFDYKTVTVEGGYSFVGQPTLKLTNGYLCVEATYAHGDAPEHTSTYDHLLKVKDGRLLGYPGTDLADANDLDACKEAVADLLYYEGGY
jgi:hypothetical protein